MDDETFAAYLDKAFTALQEKQGTLQTEYNLGSFEEYALDVDNRRIIFSGNATGRLVFDVLVIGSWAVETSTFLWGWADGTLPLEVRKHSERIKALYAITGIEIFQKDRFDADEAMALELSAMAVDVTGSLGFYRVPGDGFFRYLALEKVLGD